MTAIPHGEGRLDIPHLYGDFNGDRAMVLLRRAVNDPDALRDHVQSFLVAQPLSTQHDIQQAIAAERAINWHTGTSVMKYVMLGLLVARDQDKFDQLSAEAFHYPATFKDSLRRSASQHMAGLQVLVRNNCRPYFDMTRQVAGLVSTVRFGSKPVWAGFMDAYIMGNKQVEISRSAVSPEPLAVDPEAEVR